MPEKGKNRLWWLSLAIVVVFIVLEITVPKIARFLGVNLESQELSLYLANIIFILLVVILHFYWILFERTKDEIAASLSGQYDRILQEVRGLVTSHVVPIPREYLYSTLQDLADKFERKAWNCWFHVRPPNAAYKATREGYFSSLLKRAKHNSQETELKRLVLGTPANVAWIEELVHQYTSLPHVSLAVYTKDDSDRPLSVQIFDHKRVLIVNPQDIGDTHDLLIEDSCGVQILQYYYDALWRRSDVVLDRGTVQEAALVRVKSIRTR